MSHTERASHVFTERDSCDKADGGICMKCLKVCYYAHTYYGFYWVHADSGSYISNEPERHDCNTYIEPLD